MTEIISQRDEFKEMLQEQSYPFVELGQQTLVVRHNYTINIRQYHDDFCLSSWTKIEDFKEKIQELLKEE